jgi:uncharacterized membrane protein YkvA (DUF1232 family)
MKKSKLFKVAGAAAMEAQKDKSFFDKVKAFFRMLGDYKNGLYKPDNKNLIIGLFATLYIVSPIDIIPEALFGPFGLVDDFGILLFGMKYFNKEIAKYIAWEASRNVYQNVEDVEDAKIID